jgi:hypothetical protein
MSILGRAGRMLQVVVCVLLIPASTRAQVVINEVMYRPYNQSTAGHYEFVELYNKSAAAVDLSGMILTDDDNLAAVCGGCTGVTEGVYHVPAGTTIGPHAFLTLWHTAVAGITDRPGNLVYSPSNCGTLVLADTGDNVTLLKCNHGPVVIDSLDYHALGLPETPQNVSLERRSPDRPTQDASNWGWSQVPAGTNTGGYVAGGTPGALNSLKCLTILEPQAGAWLSRGGLLALPITVTFFVVDNPVCNTATRVDFDVRFPPSTADVLGASGATQPFEDEGAYLDPQHDGTVFPLTYRTGPPLSLPFETFTSVQYTTVVLGGSAVPGRRVTATISLDSTPYPDQPAQFIAKLFDRTGADLGSDSVDVNYDTAGPVLSAPGTFIADDDFEDLGQVPKLCVEANETLGSVEVDVRPIGSLGWIAAAPLIAGASVTPTPFGGYKYCWQDLTLPATDGATDGYDYQIIASDEHGNPSDPFPGQVACQVPEKFVAPEGQRVAMAVDNHNIAHIVYTTPNAVRYLRWSQDSWQPVQHYPDAPDKNAWGEPVSCLYGWGYHGLQGDRQLWDCRDRQEGEEERQWGANVDIVIAPDGQPAVCFIAGPKAPDEWFASQYYGTVWVLERPATPPAGQSWIWSALYSEDARYSNCALASGVPIPRPPSSYGPPGRGLGVMFTAPAASWQTAYSAPAFSLVSPTHTSGHEIVDPQVEGLDVAMTAAPDGSIHAVYVNRHASEYARPGLYHAFGGTGMWSTEPITTWAPEWGSYARLPSIALDAAAQLHVSYSTVTIQMNAYDARQLYYNTRIAGAWGPGEIVDWVLPGVELPSDETVLEGIPSRVVMGRDAADNVQPEIVYFSGTRRRGDVDPVSDPERYHTDIAQLVLAFDEHDPQNPGWHSHTLATRVDHSTGVAAATSPTGRRRVAYHNGLASQLFYEQEESGNFAFVDTHYLAPAVGCAAKSRDPATGGSRPRFVATSSDPVPGDLMNLPVARTRPPYAQGELKELFKDLRRYGYDWIDGVPRPPGYESVDWRTIDENDPYMWAGITTEGRQQNRFYMGDLMLLANELLRDLNAAQCPEGADTSLGGCWRAALGPNWATGGGLDFRNYLQAPDVAQGSVIESAFRNVRLRSGSIPKLEAKGVCLPSTGVTCDLVDSERQHRDLAVSDPAPTFYPAGRAIAFDPARPLADQITECANHVRTNGLGDGRLIVGEGVTVGTQGDGCYVCWPQSLAPDASTLWFGGYPDAAVPFCGPPTCPNGSTRVGPPGLVVSRVSGSDYLGCAWDCIQPSKMEGDEDFVAHDDTATCTRCPSGTTPARCQGGDQEQIPPLAAGVAGAVCQEGEWHRRLGCTADADCGALQGFSCQSGLCKSADGKSFQTVTGALCIPYGCQDCYRNLYCVSAPEPCLFAPDGGTPTCVPCPNNHTCTAEHVEDPAVEAPLCFGRPFLDDFRVNAALQFAASKEIQNLTSGLLAMFSSIRFPTQAGGHDISIDERLEGAGFRFGGGAFNQGYLEFTLRFRDDLNIHATCDVNVASPVILRVRLQPYFAADDTDVPSPPHYHGTTRWRVTHAHLIHDMVTGQRAEAVSSCAQAESGANQVLTSEEEDFFNQARANMETPIETLWHRLTEDMIVGGWLFGRESAIRTLHTAQDSIPIAGGLNNEGDHDPAATIETLRLWPPTDPASPQGGGAVLWYRER